MKSTELPPGRYFISRSYRDTAELELLLSSLPSHAQPFIFPPVTVKPQDFVSTPLMESILKCDGLLALEGADSEESFWVTFEREFAKRNGIPVYIWDSITMTLSRDQPSTRFSVVLFSDPSNWGDVDRIARHMRERSFEVVPVWKDPHNRWVPRDGNDLRLTPETRMVDPAFVIFTGSETRREFYYDIVALGQSGRISPHRVVIAPLTAGVEALNVGFVGSFMLQWGAIVDDLESHLVYLREGVDGPVLANRIDDLIVRVSWNMYRARGPVR
jgi:hypothetical protein